MSMQINIVKRFDDFELRIEAAAEHKRIGILGASGSGKSMTLKCLAGIETPESGIIKIDDRLLFDKENKINLRPQDRNIGYLFQEYALFPNMTVMQNIAAGIRNKDEKQKRAAKMMEAFRLEGLENRLPHQLSGGQKQRVALARIMAYNPEMILLDEPLSALDAHLRHEMLRMLQQLLEDYDGTVVMVSHSCDEIYRFCDYLLILDSGQIIAAGNTEDVFKNPSVSQAALLTGCNNILAAEAVDEHTLYLADYGINLVMKKQLDKRVKNIGIRSRDFYPVWSSEEVTDGLCIEAYKDNESQLPYETIYYMKAAKSSGGVLEWVLSGKTAEMIKKRGMPSSLGVREDDIILLK